MYVDLEHLINLSAIPGLGPVRIRALVAHFRSTERIFRASLKELTSVDSVDYKTARNIVNYSDFKFGKNQLKKAGLLGIKVISFWDNAYPENLKRIYDPPVYLYVKGNLIKTDKYAISVVGTRLPSKYGYLIAEKLTKALAKKGICIVSGLARGIDTISHHAAMQGRGRTIAVLGSGVDVLYPGENKKLAEAIVQQGALISEFPLGTGPEAPNFPKRNRLISGLSYGTLVIEAGLKSGALLTANYALEQNREVFAVPGNIDSAKSSGTNQLIKAGAKLVTSVNDILVELEHHFRPILKDNDEPKFNKIPSDLSDMELKVLQVLSNAPIHIDKLSQLIGKTTSETLSILLPLEFKDLVKQLPGKFFIKV